MNSVFRKWGEKTNAIKTPNNFLIKFKMAIRRSLEIYLCAVGLQNDTESEIFEW